MADELCYHGNTSLGEGRFGLLVDPGAWSNLAGETWIRGMVDKAIKAGHKVSQCRLPKPMKVAGVGNGTNKAEWEIHLPIALGDADQGTALHEYRVPVVGDSGKDLPALLGLQSLARQNCILEMAPGNEHLTLPGPGGYTINWSPGTIRYKLEQSPSGHLILPCDEFLKVSKTHGGVKEPMMTFFGTKPVIKKTCEIGTQTDFAEEPVRKQVNNRKHKDS
jgi:hypothetical protein